DRPQRPGRCTCQLVPPRKHTKKHEKSTTMRQRRREKPASCRGPSFRVFSCAFVDRSVKLLVTAGNTQAPIDRVRCLTNIFTGRTGAAIAVCAHDRGHDVTLLTSHPEAVIELRPEQPLSGARRRPYRYRTFDDLQSLMSGEVRGGGYDAIIHCAAVSDYLVAGVFAPAPGT